MPDPLMAKLAAMVATKGLQSFFASRAEQEKSKRAASAGLRQQLGGQQMPQPPGQGTSPWGAMINDPQVEELVRDELFGKIFGKIFGNTAEGS